MDRRTLHEEVKEKLCAAIRAGDIAPGARLPSQRALCAEYGVSHMTMRRAIDALISEGVIFSIPGKGLYATERTRPAEIGSLTSFVQHMARLGLSPTTRVLDFHLVAASPVLARTLEIAIEAAVVLLRRLRYVNDAPMSLSVCYLPHALCPGILSHDMTHESLFAVLRETYGWRLTGSQSSIAAILADAEQASLLGLERPAALLVREQITFAHTGQIVEFSRNVVRGDQYHLVVQEGDIGRRQSDAETALRRREMAQAGDS